ncbi:MAG: AAA family ATPase [Microcoleaceae cyanobacterium]
MLENLKIENFRGFQSFELQQLGRVNLLVGQNNSGKTSILEAIQLLCSRTNIEPLREIMEKRGEYIHNEEERFPSNILDIRHLFYGHEIKLKSQLSISGKEKDHSEIFIIYIGSHSSDRSNNDTNPESYSSDFNKLEEILHINDRSDNDTNPESYDYDFNELEKNSHIHIQWSDGIEEENIDGYLSDDGGLQENFRRLSRVIDYSKKIRNLPIKTNFVTSSSLTTYEMIEFFDRIVLTPEEKIVQDAVKMIDMNVERIAVISSKIYKDLGFREGFVVLRSDNHQRVPIGSFGDGTWRMLGLALAIVNVKDGVLLVDEIDTGLHFTAMSKMWKLIWETAKKLNVQVFATTHNSDCWKSLASIACEENAHEEGGITIQRIEPDKNTAIAFNEREIVIAAERDLEVR